MRLSGLVVLIAVLAATAVGQNITVASRSSTRINDGQTTHDLYNGTDFGDVAILAGPVIRTFDVRVTKSTFMALGCSWDGPHDSALTILDSPVVGHLDKKLTVQFDPSVSQEATGTISILYQHDCGYDTAEFRIRGLGVESTATLADVALTQKPSMLTGRIYALEGIGIVERISGTILISNFGGVKSPRGNMLIYQSENNTMEPDDAQVATVAMSSVPAHGAKKLRFKADVHAPLAGVGGFLIFMAVPESDADSDCTNNQIVAGF